MFFLQGFTRSSEGERPVVVRRGASVGWLRRLLWPGLAFAMINPPAPPAGHRRPSLPAVDESQRSLQTPDGSWRVEAVHCGRHLPAQPHRHVIGGFFIAILGRLLRHVGIELARLIDALWNQTRSSSGVASGAAPVWESSLRVVEDQSFSGNLVGGVVPHAGSTWSKHAPATGRRLGYAQRSRGPLPGRVDAVHA
jgi:hypothetical protein